MKKEIPRRENGQGQAKAQYGDDSFSVASSNSSKKPLPSSSVIHQEVEDDVINAILLGKVMNDCHVVENCLGRNLGEEDLMGKGLKESSFSEPNVEKNQFTIEKSVEHCINNGLVNSKVNNLIVSSNQELDIYSRVVEDVQDMGFSIGQEKERRGVINSVGGNSLWAMLIDKTANVDFVEKWNVESYVNFDFKVKEHEVRVIKLEELGNVDNLSSENQEELKQCLLEL
ncbi:hypothetical protein V6N13_103610 [Hibiscus sabdariffa]